MRGFRLPRLLAVAILSGGADRLASRDGDGSHGLFTKCILKGMSGEADARPFGNGDGRVVLDEINAYLKDTLTYFVRRYYGRDQTAQIVSGGRAVY